MFCIKVALRYIAFLCTDLFYYQQTLTTSLLFVDGGSNKSFLEMKKNPNLMLFNFSIGYICWPLNFFSPYTSVDQAILLLCWVQSEKLFASIRNLLNVFTNQIFRQEFMKTVGFFFKEKTKWSHTDLKRRNNVGMGSNSKLFFPPLLLHRKKEVVKCTGPPKMMKFKDHSCLTDSNPKEKSCCKSKQKITIWKVENK